MKLPLSVSEVFTPYPLQFQAIPQARVWGGHTLKCWFDVDCLEPIGEYWVLSGHPHATSIVTNGILAGRTLTEVVNDYPEHYLGNSPQPRFPLIIKFLEADQDLSLQIHPNDEYAYEHERDFGKTEAWYVLNCREDGRIVYGHSFPNRDTFETAVKEGTVRNYLTYQTVKPGQTVFVPARTLHAILAGTIVLEVQQTSDVTYRVYDWDRVDENGRGRPLHVQKAADVLTYERVDSHVCKFCKTKDDHDVQQNCSWFSETLVQCENFKMEKWIVEPGQHLISRPQPSNPDVLIGLQGTGVLWTMEVQLKISRASTILIPTHLPDYQLNVTEKLEAIHVTY